MTNNETKFLLYKTDNSNISIDVIISNETLWTTQKAMAELFGVGAPAISKHLSSIFESNELDKEVVISKMETTTQHGAIEGKTQSKETNFYNLFTMQEFANSIDRFLEFQEYKVLPNNGSVSITNAKAKASLEYDQFNKTQKINSDFDKQIKRIMADEQSH